MKKPTLRGMCPGLQNFNLASLVIAGCVSIFASAVFSLASLAQDVANPQVEKKPVEAVDPEIVAALERRIKILESQIIDLRAMIGTVHSMRPPANRGFSQGPNPSWQSDAAPASPPSSNQYDGRVMGGVVGDEGSNSRLRTQFPEGPLPPESNLNDADRGSSARTERSSGMITSGDEQRDERRVVSATPFGGTSDRNSDRPVETQDARALYKDAYSHMLRRDYKSAENAFATLINNHPNSKMAGNAQYWLGETFYVRGKYRPAADSFLKAYQKFPNGVKAPDSLMKLALSLVRLDQKGAACKTFDELYSKYPNAPSHVKQRADMEKRRAGCN